jgi:ABC-type lipoprotein export system ATPase subunit
MKQITVQLKKVHKDYACGQVVNALRDINLTVTQGERVAIMSPSGSGISSPTSFHCSQTNQKTT